MFTYFDQEGTKGGGKVAKGKGDHGEAGSAVVGDNYGRALVFGGKVLICFANESLADLFPADFDGYCGGDVVLHWRGEHTRARLAKGELLRPTADHRGRLLGGHGSPCLEEEEEEEVWNCEPLTTERSRKFCGDWCDLDILMEEKVRCTTKRTKRRRSS